MSKSFADAWRNRNRVQVDVTKYWIDSSWTKGRNQYLTFHVRIRDERLIRKITKIQSKLSIIPCVAPFPKDYFHISIAGLGFLAKSEEHEDDILLEKLERIINQAKEALRSFSRFDASLSKLNIFPDVVFVEVHDGGKIGEISRRLQVIPEIGKTKSDYPGFLPHISIMHFQENKDSIGLIDHLEKLRDTEFGKMTVHSIELVNAHLLKKYPKLNTLHTFELE